MTDELETMGISLINLQSKTESSIEVLLPGLRRARAQFTVRCQLFQMCDAGIAKCRGTYLNLLHACHCTEIASIPRETRRTEMYMYSLAPLGNSAFTLSLPSGIPSRESRDAGLQIGESSETPAHHVCSM
jgi:hypothetical protein